MHPRLCGPTILERWRWSICMLSTALPASMNLVTIAVAATYLGVSTMTIRRRIADGTLPAFRTGPRLIRVDLDDLGQVLLRRIPAAGTRPPV